MAQRVPPQRPSKTPVTEFALPIDMTRSSHEHTLSDANSEEQLPEPVVESTTRVSIHLPNVTYRESKQNDYEEDDKSNGTSEAKLSDSNTLPAQCSRDDMLQDELYSRSKQMNSHERQQLGSRATQQRHIAPGYRIKSPFERTNRSQSPFERTNRSQSPFERTNRSQSHSREDFGSQSSSREEFEGKNTVQSNRSQSPQQPYYNNTNLQRPAITNNTNHVPIYAGGVFLGYGNNNPQSRPRYRPPTGYLVRPRPAGPMYTRPSIENIPLGFAHRQSEFSPYENHTPNYHPSPQRPSNYPPSLQRPPNLSPPNNINQSSDPSTYYQQIPVGFRPILIRAPRPIFQSRPQIPYAIRHQNFDTGNQISRPASPEKRKASDAEGWHETELPINLDTLLEKNLSIEPLNVAAPSRNITPSNSNYSYNPDQVASHIFSTNSSGLYRANSININSSKSVTETKFEVINSTDDLDSEPHHRSSTDNVSILRQSPEILSETDVLGDSRPTFVTLSRKKNQIAEESISPDQALENLRQQFFQTSDLKVHFEFAKACLATGDSYADEGFALLKKLASQGFPEAYYFLGDAFADDGKDSLAYNQYLMAAKRGHAPACHAIARCAEIGKGCKKSIRLCLEMYTKAATAGNLDAMYRLGTAELNGSLGLRPDVGKAVKWFKRAAAVPNRDHPEPLFELAKIYETGVAPYVNQDFAYARGVLMEASDFGYPAAIYKLGYSYEHGLLGLDVNPAESIRLYTLAMKVGDSEALLGMAGWHMTGADGIIPKNDENAYYLVQQASDKGLPRAQYTLGHII